MINLNYILAAFGGGFVLGGGIGFVFASRKTANECRQAIDRANARADRLEKEVTELRDKHRKALDRINSELDSTIKKDMKPDKSKTHKNFKQIVEKYGLCDEDEIVAEPCVELEVEYPKEESEDPMIITRDEYANDFANCECTCLTYYPVDDVLGDEMDDVIDNPEDILGDKIWDEIRGTEENEVFVHNESRDMNYEIVIAHGLSYERDIRGYDAFR